MVRHTLKTGLSMACAWALLAAVASPEDGLKTFYEEQRARLAAEFKAPDLGSEIALTLAGGQARKGILMKLTDAEVSLFTETGWVAYPRGTLHESSRSLLFAEDYAHAKASETTRLRKQRMLAESLEEEQANLRDGTLSVVSKIEKKSDRSREQEERTTRSGDSFTVTTDVRTQTEVQRLSVTVANNTPHPCSYVLEWFFLSKPVGGGAAVVHDRGRRSVAVAGRNRAALELVSPGLEVATTATSRESSTGHSGDPSISQSGAVGAGYVVLLKHGEAILDKKASSGNYLEDEWLQRLGR